MEMAYRDRWRAEIAAFKKILAGFDLVEETKWGKPCYTQDGTNVVLIQGFKEYIALDFFQGALLKDPKKLLTRLGQVQAGRVMKFTGTAEISRKAPAIKSFVRAAMAHARAGLKAETRPLEIAVPEELTAKFRKDKKLKSAFEKLTPGRQRSWLFHIAGAKQSATRAARVEKSVPGILAGRGFLERP